MENFDDIELKEALNQGHVSEIARWLEGKDPHDIAKLQKAGRRQQPRGSS